MTTATAITIYTDGACKGNPGPGGWGVLIMQASTKVELHGGHPQTTNNRMEMQAVIEALTALSSMAPTTVALYLDSQYVRQGITSWLAGWKRKGWRTADGSPVKNIELWQALDALVLASKHKIDWRWVKGHAGDPGNERADALANLGVQQVRTQLRAA